MSTVRVGRTGDSHGKRRARTRAHATRPTSAHPGGTALAAWPHALASAPPPTAAEAASRTCQAHSAARAVRGRVLRVQARPSTGAGHPASWHAKVGRRPTQQPLPDGLLQQLQHTDEHEVDEDLQKDSQPTDGAELGALSEHDRHDASKLLYCERRRTAEHQQVSCARSTLSAQVRKVHGGGTSSGLLQSRGSLGSHTFTLKCKNSTLDPKPMRSMVLMLLEPANQVTRQR